MLSSFAFTEHAASEHTAISSYLDSIVDSNMAETRLELTNQTNEVVSNTSYQYSLDGEAATQLVAKVEIKMLTAEEALAPNTDAE